MIKSLLETFKQEVLLLEVSQQIELLQKIHDMVDPLIIPIPQENNKLRFINASEIEYIREQKKSGIIYMETEEIHYQNTTLNLMDHLVETSLNFKYLNNGLLANIQKMDRFDSYKNIVYFVGGSKVDVTGAAIRNIVVKHLGKERDISETSIFKVQFI